MRVLFIAQYGPLAASSRTRVFQYLPFLARAGIETRVRVVIPDRWSTRIGHHGAASRLLYYVASFVRTAWVGFGCVLHASSFDRIVIQKVLFPGPVAVLLGLWRSKIVFDFDDAIFTTDAPRGIPGRVSAWRRRSGLPRMLRAASVAIVENDAITVVSCSRGRCNHSAWGRTDLELLLDMRQASLAVLQFLFQCA